MCRNRGFHQCQHVARLAFWRASVSVYAREGTGIFIFKPAQKRGENKISGR